MEKIEFENYVRAGKIASETVKYAKSFIKSGMLLLEIADKIEDKIKELGGGIAFPVNLSMNEVAAHYSPSSRDTTKSEGLLKVDLGVEVGGFIADTAFSLDLTDDKKFEKMIKLNELVLEKALAKVKAGFKLKEIGNTIQAEVEDYNKKNNTKFSIIRNLSGHALGENQIHAGLTISNYRNENETELDDIAIAIEPFLTEGVGEIYESSSGEIFMLQSDGQARDRDARKVLEFIKENYQTRPFCKRWLEKAGLPKVNLCLSLLTKQDILHNFPVLIEKSKMPVSQQEHTVVLNEKVVITTK